MRDSHLLELQLQRFFKEKIYFNRNKLIMTELCMEYLKQNLLPTIFRHNSTFPIFHLDYALCTQNYCQLKSHTRSKTRIEEAIGNLALVVCTNLLFP
jgi:hypothetical protein